jgi:tetratricopeptide (TPR) repeat protein
MTDQFTLILITSGLVFVGVVVGVYLYQSHIKNEGKAQLHYSTAKNRFEEWLLQNRSEKQAADRAKTEEGLNKELQTLSSDFKSTFANKMAFEIRAHLEFQKKNWVQAATYYLEFQNALPKADQELALYPLAQTYEEAKDFTKALGVYDQMLSRGNSAFVPLAAMGKARSLRNLNRPDEAIKTYEEFLEKHSDSTEVSQIRGLLALTRSEIKK